MTAVEYAKLRGRSKAWVSEQIAQGMPAQGTGRSGSAYRITPSEAIEWEVQRARLAVEVPPGSDRERLIRAQAEKFELENALRRRELCLVSYVETVFQGMTSDITARLDAIAGRLANEFPGNDPAAVRAKVRAETDAVRTGVGEYFATLAESAPVVAEPKIQTPATPDRRRTNRRAQRAAISA